MEGKHTPGPWRVGDAGTTIFGPPSGAPSPRTIGYVTRHATEGAEDRANARLIAAAPDLLAALVALRDAKKLSTQDLRRCADRILDAAIGTLAD